MVPLHLKFSHAFATQSFVDELAIAAGKDHRSFILELIGPPRVVDLGQAKRHFWDPWDSSDAYLVDTGRLREVVELAAKEAGWGRKLPQGHGLGLAVHRSFGSYVAVVIEAAVDEGGVTVPRIDIAVDCGPIVDPDRVRAQMEGAAIMGLSLALKSEISYKSGRVLQNNFDDYRVLRMSDAPRETLGAYCPAWIRLSSWRGWRAGGAANCASPLQCDPCCYRQAHTYPAAWRTVAKRRDLLKSARVLSIGCPDQ